MPSNKGYIYCLSNPSMPGILKCGITIRTPLIRLKEANSSDTWRPPTLYVLEFAKYVKNPKEKEQQLHSLLEKSGLRIHPRREFFNLSLTDAYSLYSLMDGTWWNPYGEDFNNNASNKTTSEYMDTDCFTNSSDTDETESDCSDDTPADYEHPYFTRSKNKSA